MAHRKSSREDGQCRQITTIGVRGVSARTQWPNVMGERGWQYWNARFPADDIAEDSRHGLPESSAPATQGHFHEAFAELVELDAHARGGFGNEGVAREAGNRVYFQHIGTLCFAIDHDVHP